MNVRECPPVAQGIIAALKRGFGLDAGPETPASGPVYNPFNAMHGLSGDSVITPHSGAHGLSRSLASWFLIVGKGCRRGRVFLQLSQWVVDLAYILTEHEQTTFCFSFVAEALETTTESAAPVRRSGASRSLSVRTMPWFW